MVGIGRFFSLPRALLALGLVGVSAVFGVRSVLEAQAGNAPVGALILSSCVFLFGLALLLTSFPHGCSKCKVALEDASATFPLSSYERLNQSLVQRNAEALLELRLEPKEETHYAKLCLEYCPRCEAVGRAKAITQHYNGEFVKTEQQGPRVPADAELISSALELIQKRALL